MYADEHAGHARFQSLQPCACQLQHTLRLACRGQEGAQDSHAMHGTARAIRIPETDKHDGLREKGGRELQPFQE